MDEALKKRLVGAAVLVALAIIFIPALIGKDSVEEPHIGQIPSTPEKPPKFAAQLLEGEVLAPEIPQPVQAELEPPEPKASQTAAEPKPNTQVHADLQAWAIQVGSFSDRENAQRLVAKLRKAKFQTPDAKQVNLQGKIHYRVRVGPMLQKPDAEKILSKVNAVSGTKGRIVRHP